MQLGTIRVERKHVACVWDHTRRVSWPDVLEKGPNAESGDKNSKARNIVSTIIVGRG